MNEQRTRLILNRIDSIEYGLKQLRERLADLAANDDQATAAHAQNAAENALTQMVRLALDVTDAAARGDLDGKTSTE